MCTYSSTQTPYAAFYSSLGLPLPSKTHLRHFRLRLLNRRRAQSKESKQKKKLIVVKAEIKMKNLKLLMENQSIIEENEKLRKKAMLLHKENEALLSQLQKKLSDQNTSKASH